jgi:hypothetical protein
MPDRANIKVSRETFEELRAAKDDGETWETFLRNSCLDRNEPTLEDVLARLDDLPDRTAEAVLERLQR